MTIKQLMQEAHAIAKDKGWYDGEPRTFGDYCALFHSEISEAFEMSRGGHPPTETFYEGYGNPKPEGVPIELADLLIRVLDYCEYAGIDIEEAIRVKMEYNKTRSYRHGGKTT